MRLINLTAHSHLSPHSFCLNRHAEWNTYIFKAAFFIISFCQICHHSGIQMCLRPTYICLIHQICRYHIHHSTGTDTWRSVCRLLMHGFPNSFFCIHKSPAPFSNSYSDSFIFSLVYTFSDRFQYSFCLFYLGNSCQLFRNFYSFNRIHRISLCSDIVRKFFGNRASSDHNFKLITDSLVF